MKQLGTSLLETERIILRRIEADDYKQMYENWACLEECSEFFPWSAADDIEVYRKRVAAWAESYSNSLYFNWGIEWKEERKLIGMINLHNVDEENESAETSYILAPEFWGRGIMTEALRCVLEYAFHDLKLNRVEADVFAGNAASERVLEKCGMRCEGIAKEKYYKNGRYVDSVRYAILCKDMIQIRTAAENDYSNVREFYYRVTDALRDMKYTPGWEKDVYPAQEFLLQSIARGELFVGELCGQMVSCMVVNHEYNEGYKEINWSVKADDTELLVIHALGVHPEFSGRGIAKKMVQSVMDLAETNGIRTIRLDVLEGNLPAEKAYTKLGFRYVDTVCMFYEDTGWTNYRLFEYVV